MLAISRINPKEWSLSVVTTDKMNLFEPVLAGDRGVFASNGSLYKGAVFGRDSLEVAEDLYIFDEDIPKNIIRTIASLQGLEYSPLREEEPGKIHHEHRRSLDIDLQQDVLVRMFKNLSAKWGGDNKEFTYYGSVDATPLFVRLVGKYIEAYGDSILSEGIYDKRGDHYDLYRYLERSADWLEHKIAVSSLGFVEYHRSNPLGIQNQVWKDSEEGYVHINGEKVSHREPVAPLEVQAYTYDALLALSKVFQRSRYAELAKNLNARIIDNFWVEDGQFFAQAIDRGPDGQPRPVLVPSSNEGLLLDSGVLDDKPQLAQKIIANMTSVDFLTRAGVRCRSIKYANLVPYADYHGSYAVWPKETSDIARGMFRHGYVNEGLDLSRRIVSAFSEAGDYFELFYVDENDHMRRPFDVDSTSKLKWGERPCIAEPGQAWSISAFIQAMYFIDKFQEPKASVAA